MSSVWLATFLVINLSWCLATRASPAAWGRRLAGTLLWPRAPGQVPPLPTGSWLCQAVIIDPDTPSYPGTGPVCWSTWSLSEADWDSPHTPVLWWVLPGTVTADCISVYNGLTSTRTGSEVSFVFNMRKNLWCLVPHPLINERIPFRIWEVILVMMDQR